MVSDMAAVLEPTWTLGDRFRKAREMAGLSREEMAKKLTAFDPDIKTTKASVWNWEADVSRPRDVLATTYAWAEITGVNVEWLRSRCSSGEWLSDSVQLEFAISA